MATIGIFCLASIGFRKVFRVHPVQSMVLLLVPEFFTNAILAMVMLAGDLSTAAYTLIALTVILLGIAAIGQLQISRYNRSIPAPKANDYIRLNQNENDDEGDGDLC